MYVLQLVYQTNYRAVSVSHTCWYTVYLRDSVNNNVHFI